ncbi:MAG: alpha amylase C-terminal domain-containing protein [Spirochaetes bacterium]|nr:alpha amylase C-terminal domain-containing protein [Spirochaetota bacterium]
MVADDPWLEPHKGELARRIRAYDEALLQIQKEYGSLEDFALLHRELGIHWDAKKKGWWYREWAPSAWGLSLMGDFNGWNRESHPLARRDDGVWELFLPHAEYAATFTHASRVKVHVNGQNGRRDRIPACITRVVQDPQTMDFSGQVWFPPQAYEWRDGAFTADGKEPLFIYEAHVGMAQEREGLGTYREFADIILPRIKALGYNTVQLMAIAEHPYYGSFGYHVGNFFCPSSRFGTPEDLKYLVDRAHGLGLRVIMDLVHSHSVKNLAEGLNQFDGSDDQYFHPGGRGIHEGWDSLLFNYGKAQVRRFLLSNVRWWIEEFHFDGYRFDGVTSMLYFHHGAYTAFTNYEQYFVKDVDWDVLVYLQLANTLLHRLKPWGASICEDMSGMPGACRPPRDGGLGFDYRLGMGIPDFWIKLIKERRDEDWNLRELWHQVTNRRWKEKTIAYCESHDQALVGDKTIAFRLMDQEMYWHMRVDDGHPTIERGVALHKLIRLFTLALGGEGWMNFMGNEFGHPEWIDFPREGNGWSYKYARRQWSLVDHPALKYRFLSAFDASLIHFASESGLLAAPGARELHIDETNHVLCAERANRIFVFNWGLGSIFDYRFACPSGKYRLVLCSDDAVFGGHGRVDGKLDYFTQREADGNDRLSIYCTSRTGMVFQRVEG